MHRTRSLLALLTCALLAGCATGRARPASTVARLERASVANPRSASVLRALGIAYYKAGQMARARTTLEQARTLAPKDGATALYLGLAAEQTGDVAVARAAYSSYLTYGKTRRVRRQLEARLAALARRELTLAAKSALAQEATLAQLPAPRNTIAVLPLRFYGADSTLAPLERGIADLLITDLGRAPSLTIVERDKMQALLAEIALSKSGRIDAATSLRAGRLVRAGRVIQGSITPVGQGALRVDAAIVDVPTTQALSGVSAADRLEQIFAIEKKIALGIFEALGITLTTAQRALVDERPTRSLSAFLAYSRGLQEDDAGNFDRAAQLFREATRLDPGFSAAISRGDRAQAASTAPAATPVAIEASLRGTSEGVVVAAAQQGTTPGAGGELGATLTTTTNDINPSPAGEAAGSLVPAPSLHDPASSATGTDTPLGSASGTIVIIIRQP
jgi:TolB-like protein